MIHQSDNHPTDIFTDNIKLDIHYAANNESMEIGMLISIRYDSHLEGIIRRVTYSCLLYTSPSPRDPKTSRMPSSA